MIAAAPRDVFAQILDPLADCLTSEVARRILDISLESRTQERVNQLADRANAGQLSESERTEYARYIEAMDFLAILKANAHLALARERAK